MVQKYRLQVGRGNQHNAADTRKLENQAFMIYSGPGEAVRTDESANLRRVLHNVLAVIFFHEF
ncbi:predicted protein [Plenodomus lingam JN3]|uniref:Predicted protein n=1 Tax=Leptosphaeria maculans (strain JN3 / isolate v23.1.3 / race Av1-4-5-6-7-8) TaxID=985895 RepID=E4ZNB0_LEPMJ|nr:predicted protein [Plenodomus lingam JN3]CBX92969.1 predicted protein [Plenodomus lingam JN3]